MLNKFIVVGIIAWIDYRKFWEQILLLFKYDEFKSYVTPEFIDTMIYEIDLALRRRFDLIELKGKKTPLCKWMRQVRLYQALIKFRAEYRCIMSQHQLRSVMLILSYAWLRIDRIDKSYDDK